MIDYSFVLFYSLGGAVVWPFLEPVVWIPAIIIGRNSPRRLRFWFELLPGFAFAFLVGWGENHFASMVGLDGNVVVIQFLRPCFAELLATLAACGAWEIARHLVPRLRVRKDVASAFD
jgi:hypothetical protein